MQNDGSLKSHQGTEHKSRANLFHTSRLYPIAEKRYRADSETSPRKRRRLSHQKSNVSLAERDGLCESAQNLAPDQLPSPSLTKSGREPIEPSSTGGKKRRCLPLSPSTSSSLQSESYRLLQPNLQDLSKGPQSAPAEFGSAFDIEHPTHHPQGQKRKRSKSESEAEDGSSTPQKRRQTAKAIEASNVLGPEGTDREKKDTEACTPISLWARTGRWPENFSAMSQEPSNSSKKRPPSSSYTKSYKDGEVPKAHSAAHEKHFAEHGLFMEELNGRSRVRKDSKSLCTDFLRSIHPEPQYTTFPLEQFLVVWQRAQTRNEAKLYRDITPLLVPSPELLWICGHDRLEHVVDEISVEWTKCKTLGGPKPKPDFAVGIAPSQCEHSEHCEHTGYIYHTHLALGSL